jgi:hypothetical protein
VTSDTAAANIPETNGSPTTSLAPYIRIPEWFRAFDIALALLAIVLAFLVSSFIARNSDLWRHLATGRLIAQFSYPYGGDPLTYTAADRVWVNSSWLTETAFYGLYSIDPSGAVLVAVKAIAFAAVFAVLFLLRKPQAALWPWVVSVVLAIIGASLLAQLRPIVFGWLMYSIFLVTLFRSDWTRGSKWRMPLILGAIVALWSNVDSFAFLAPFSILLLLLGEIAQNRLLSSPAPKFDPFPTVPPVAVLTRTLAVISFALLLNPTFLAGVVRQPGEAISQLLPFECDLTAKSSLAPDRDLARFTFSMGSKEFYYDSIKNVGNKIYGWNLNTLASGMIVGISLVLSVIGFRNGRASHLLLWFGLATLPLLVNSRFIGAFLIVSVIVMACQLNALGGSVAQLPASHPSARIISTLLLFGRFLTLIVLALLVVFSIPGWLHPQFDSRALDRWVAWSVEPDEGIQRAGELIQNWRTDRVKSAAFSQQNGMLTHPEFGDYIAWFAPAEKAFLNSRFRLHRQELPDLIELRKWLIYSKVRGEADEKPVVKLLEKNQASYLCVGQPFGNIPSSAILYAYEEFVPAGTNRNSEEAMNGIWHFDGRLAIIGRADTPEGNARSAVLKWNPAQLAFGPRERSKIDENSTVLGALNLDGDWVYDFVVRPTVMPVSLSDSKAYSLFAALRRQIAMGETQRRAQEWVGTQVMSAYLLGGGPIAFQTNRIGPKPVLQTDADFALPILAVQSARQATRLDPQDHRSYMELATAYTLEVPELEPGENRVQVLTALTRAAARLPIPVEGERTRTTPASMEVQMRLFKYHLQSNTLDGQYVDLARASLTNLLKLAPGANDEEFRPEQVLELWGDWYNALWIELATFAKQPVENRPPNDRLLDLFVEQKMLEPTDDIRKWGPQKESDLTRELALDRLKKLEVSMRESIRRRNDLVDRGPAETKFQNYMRLGLPGKALESVDVKNVAPELMMQFIYLHYTTGQLEKGFEYRKEFEELISKLGANDPRAESLRLYMKQYELTESRLAGNFQRAEVLLEEEYRRAAKPKFTEAERNLLAADLKGHSVALASVAGVWPSYMTANTTGMIRQELHRESSFLFQRGMMALLNGDTVLAKKQFDNASRPQGMDLKVVGVPQNSPTLAGYLPKYQELLNQYLPQQK